MSFETTSCFGTQVPGSCFAGSNSDFKSCQVPLAMLSSNCGQPFLSTVATSFDQAIV